MSSAFISLSFPVNPPEFYTVSVSSNLSLPRPTVIAYNEYTFDIFHMTIIT